MNQSELEANSCNWGKARENAREQGTIGFGFTSDWLKSGASVFNQSQHSSIANANCFRHKIVKPLYYSAFTMKFPYLTCGGCIRRQLSQMISPSSFTLEHMAASLSQFGDNSIPSAPRDFSVWVSARYSLLHSISQR